MIRNLKASRLDKANYLFVNSESKDLVSGNTNDFVLDITNLPIDKNKSYNIYIKNIYFPNMSPQITNNYNYNKIGLRVMRTSDNFIMASTTITISEGTYNASQLAYYVVRAINNYSSSVAGTYGGDSYNIGYDDITNRLYIIRSTVTAVGGQTYYFTLLANDTNTLYNGEHGFGLAYILGLNYDSTFNLPSTSGTTLIFPLPPQLYPYLYFYITIDGVNNVNLCSDIPNLNNIVFRCPLALDQPKYTYTYIEEAIPEFGQMVMSTLPTKIRISVIDQYGNLFPLSDNTAIDMTLKLVPIE